MNIFNLECPKCSDGALPIAFTPTGEQNCYFVEIKKCVCCEHIPTPDQAKFLFATMIGSYNSFKTAQRTEQQKNMDQKIKDLVKDSEKPEMKLNKETNNLGLKE